MARKLKTKEQLLASMWKLVEAAEDKDDSSWLEIAFRPRYPASSSPEYKLQEDLKAYFESVATKVKVPAFTVSEDDLDTMKDEVDNSCLSETSKKAIKAALKAAK